MFVCPTVSELHFVVILVLICVSDNLSNLILMIYILFKILFFGGIDISPSKTKRVKEKYDKIERKIER